MDNNLFINNKIEDIEIPKELNNLMVASIKKGEEKLRVKNIINSLKNEAILIFIITLLLNISPSFATFASDLPIVGKIAEIMIFDKGIKNAVENGLYQKIGYSETKDGITIKVNDVVGDFRTLQFSIDIIGAKNKEVEIDIENADGYLNSSQYGIVYENEEFKIPSIELKFEKILSEFIMVFKVKEEGRGISKFEVPIKLNEKFNKDINEISNFNNVIQTEVGEIKIKNIDSSITRTRLEFEFLSDEYDFMGFENDRLIDSNFEEFSSSNSYKDVINNIMNIEFQGDLSNKKELIFKADAMYYARKDNRILKLDLKNKSLESNDYNIRILNEDEIRDNQLYNEELENYIVLGAKGVMGLSFTENEKIKFISSSHHSIERSEKTFEEIKNNSEVFILFEALTDERIIELEIQSVIKDRIEEIEFKLK